jgi:hypothetical protein
MDGELNFFLGELVGMASNEFVFDLRDRSLASACKWNRTNLRFGVGGYGDKGVDVVHGSRNVVLYDRERVMEVMKHAFPVLIRGGPTKSDSVILKSSPSHEQNIAVVGLQAASQFMGKIAARSGDNRGCLFKGGFKVGARPSTDGQNCDLQDGGVVHGGWRPTAPQRCNGLLVVTVYFETLGGQ